MAHSGCEFYLSTIPITTELLLLIAICMQSYAIGIHIAFPSVLNSATLEPNIKITPDQASWIATSPCLGGFVGLIVIPVTFEVFGRKLANLISNLAIFIGTLIIYVANDVYTLIIARIVTGLIFGGSYTTLMTICECMPPKRRGYFMVFNKISMGVGALFCHAAALILNWRQIAICGALPICVSIVLLIICADSPSFFAKRMQFDKCEKAFKWYRGDSLSAKKELKELVAAQMENVQRKQRKTNINFFKKTKDTLLTKEFRKSFFIVTLAAVCVDSSGRYFIPAYITQILLKLINNRCLAIYISVATDFILILGLSISSILLKRYKRRTILFRSGFCAVFLMFMVSLIIILRNKLSILQYGNWLIPVIIISHTFLINVGLIPVAFAISGEVYSLDQRGLGSVLSSLIYLVFLNILMKLTQTMMDNTGVEGTYFIYGLCLFVSLLLLRRILPETKDKTLQNIEDEIKGIVRNNSEVELMKISSK